MFIIHSSLEFVTWLCFPVLMLWSCSNFVVQREHYICPSPLQFHQQSQNTLQFQHAQMVTRSRSRILETKLCSSGISTIEDSRRSINWMCLQKWNYNVVGRSKSWDFFWCKTTTLLEISSFQSWMQFLIYSLVKWKRDNIHGMTCIFAILVD